MIKKASIVSLICLLFLAPFAHAADLYISPGVGTYDIGDSFTVNVIVSSPDRALNAVSGKISFSDNLEMVSLSQVGSIIRLWPQDPYYSNASKTVNFEGIVLNPGFLGSSGRIMSLTFKAKSVGNSSVGFSSAAVLANDGNGTNILNHTNGGIFSVKKPVPSSYLAPKEIIAETEPEIVDPGIAKVSSSTHPNQDRWYNSNDPKFEWSLLEGTTGVNIMSDKNPDTDPGIKSDGLFSSYKYTEVESGEWYFHIKLKNNYAWGKTVHFKYRIDTVSPVFEIEEIKRDGVSDPKVSLSMKATDLLSGMDHYKIMIDGDNPIIWFDDGSHVYETPALSPGEHELLIEAYDKAGNHSEQPIKIQIEAIKPPVIDSYSEKLNEGEVLVVKGKACPNSQIVLWLTREGSEAQSYATKSGSDGVFSFDGVKPKAGVYALAAETVNEFGTKSELSNKFSLSVAERKGFDSIFSVFSFVLTTVPWVVFGALLFIGLCYAVKELLRVHREAFRNKKKAEEENYEKEMVIMRKSIKKGIDILEEVKTRRQLTEEEEILIGEMKVSLKDAKKVSKPKILKVTVK